MQIKDANPNMFIWKLEDLLVGDGILEALSYSPSASVMRKVGHWAGTVRDYSRRFVMGQSLVGFCALWSRVEYKREIIS
jgi:hypothetical protein